MNAPTVTIVIPVWNGRDFLLRLLDKLRQQTHPITQVIAVDNGSQDGAADEAEKQGARVLRLGSNRGFARAVNEGIEASKTELVALVNSDIEPEPEWLARLCGAMEPNDVWFATGKILSATQRDRIDGVYDLVSRGACAVRVGHGRPAAEFSQSRRISMTSATAALFRTELFQKVGLFDTVFESYLEDVDLGLRCASQGLRGAYIPEAIAYHHGSASLGAWSPTMVRLIARNQVLLAAKHFPVRYWWPILIGQILWGLVALRHGAGLAFVRGKFEGIRLSRSIPRNPTTSDVAEGEIRATQSDFYWRVYFLLTSGGAD